MEDINEIVLFIETMQSNVSRQGEDVAKGHGYEVWLLEATEEPEGLNQTFIGWVALEDRDEHVAWYQAQGDTVWLAPLESGGQ